MFPAALWPVLVERQVDAAARWLFVSLFLHPETDAAGFLAWQPKQLATVTGLEPRQVESAADHLQEKQLLLVDRGMERGWLAPFMEYDTSRKPNMYVAAMRSIRVCSSRRLKAGAWAEVQRIHPPPLKLKAATPEETRRRLVAEREGAYEELEESVRRDQGTVQEPFENRLRTIAEPPAVPAPVPGGGRGGAVDDDPWCSEDELDRLESRADRLVWESYDQ